MWTNFEHQIWQKIKSYELEGKNFALAVSGGVDSLSLITVFKKLNLAGGLKVLHFHHGDSENKEFRDQAQEIVQQMCQRHGILYFFEKSETHLKSEADCRQARIVFFQKHTARDILVTGHHLDDVFETRLIKMIRGAGASGIRAFSEYNYKIFRPFLSLSKQQIIDYANENKIQWVNDPTNLENDYLRNWIRNDWLVALESKHPGGVQQLAKSLDRLLPVNEDLFAPIQFLDEKCIVFSRLWFFALATKDQLKVLSKCLMHFGTIEYTVGNLQEINKRLDKNQKEHIFNELGLNWVLNAQQIMIRSEGI